jgi:hypothetical protein
METQKKEMMVLMNALEQYSVTSVELFKLKALSKVTGVVSQMTSRFLFMVILLLGMVMLNVSAALWLGEVFGKNYYGFLGVALFDGFFGVAIYLLHTPIRTKIGNMFVAHVIH